MRLIDADELAPMIARLFEMMPTVDPVKHGHWEVIGQPYMRKHFQPVCCSVCKRRGYNTPYCPNCGALMDGDENE